MRITRLALPIAAALAAASCSDTSGPQGQPLGVEGPAMVTFAFAGRPADTMVVIVNDTATVAAARRRIATGSGPQMIVGRIVRGSLLDTRYPFHFDPDSVRLADTAMELCDGAPMHTSADVDSFFLGETGNAQAQSATWCPWSSYPIKVETLVIG